MIRNYIIISWRSLLRNRLFSFINIFGLALSMSVGMMVLLRIVDNFSYDTFHPASEKTFRILSGLVQRNGHKTELATTPLPLEHILSTDTGLIQEAVRLYPALRHKAVHNETEFTIQGAFTNEAFFKVFGFTLKYGNRATALQAPFSIVLSEATSTRLFGSMNPVGEVISFDRLGEFEVTGVLLTPPEKSHITFEAYASSSSVMALEQQGLLLPRTDEWDTFEEAYTYVLLKEDVSQDILVAKLNSVAASLNHENHQAIISFFPQALSNITPGARDLYHETSRGNSWSKLLTEVAIALIILVSACFNYTNLSIARALTRGKEVGIRKLSGARRWQIFAQYITESLLIAFGALCVSQVFLAFILEYQPFNSGYEMVPAITIDAPVVIVFIAFTFFAGIIAGAIPAWILSSFKPVKVLRSMWSENIMGGISLRKGLMVFQFSLSLVVLIFLTAFYKQFQFMGSADAGFAKANILVVPFKGNHLVLDAAVSQISGVERIAHTSAHFGGRPTGRISLYSNESLLEYQQISYYNTDASLIEMMQLDLVAGENFSHAMADERFVLINERAAVVLGHPMPADAVGTQYYLEDSTTVTVKGVIKDFYHRSVGNPLEPLVFRDRPSGFAEALVAISPAAHGEVKARIESAWKDLYPDQSPAIQWLDEKIADMHNPTADISLLGFLAFITVTVATMGLLGLVIYTVETKRKEISIRKIVGASVVQIMVLLSSGYMRLLIIAGAIAVPLGYALSTYFLMAFANRTAFGMGSLAFGFLLLMTIGLITISSQTFYAARQNPSQNLRSE